MTHIETVPHIFHDYMNTSYGLPVSLREKIYLSITYIQDIIQFSSGVYWKMKI